MIIKYNAVSYNTCWGFKNASRKFVLASGVFGRARQCSFANTVFGVSYLYDGAILSWNWSQNI